MGFDNDILKDILKLLGPAVEAGRRALGDLDAKEVPARLRAVARAQGGRLPAPLARSLLEALDTDEALRAKAAELAPEVPGTGPAQRASGAFLVREPGWWAVVAEAAAAAVAAADEEKRERSERAAARATAKADEARRRERAARDRVDAVAREARAKAAEDTDRLKEALLAHKGEIESLRRRLRVAGEEAAAAAEVHATAARENRELVSRLRIARGELAAAERAARMGGSGSLPREPLAMAKMLDEVATVARVRVEPPAAAPVVEGHGSPFTLPPGVAPDRAEAIEWLIAEPRRFTLVVDGYNVTFLFGDEAGFSSGSARNRLNTALGRLQRAMRAGKVIVVYDSGLAGERHTVAGPEGIEIRFSAEGRSGDDAVVALAAGSDRPVVVVSTDREVRERAAALGAVALWSEALVAWIG